MLGQVDKNLSELIKKLSWIHKELQAAEEAECSEEIVAWLKQRMKQVEQEIVESDADLHA
jgi:acetylornithine deacetylase/succinyl-diaminopimelate desuccinylase-like protein